MEIKRLSDQMISESFAKHAQDVYVLPASEVFYIYFRYGKKRTFWKEVSSADGQQLISRFKYLGQMDIGEKRKAQLGAFTYSLEKQEVRLRLSSVGDYLQRESLVIRLLYGISETPHRCFNSRDFATILQKTVRRGLYLFSGPVGSGKTSLMYRLALKEKRQVITIEDPVEIEEPFFLQLQINPKIAQTYDTLLKLALRHRPDLLIIGEIRDESTAHAAVRAALTGHRVFATVHARNLEGTLIRIKGLTRSQQNQFAQTMGELLLTGFSLQESLYLLLTIRSFQPAILANIQHQLKEGQPFSEVLSQTGYGAEQLVQIELAELHGNLPATLLEIAKQLRLVEGFRNDLKKLLAYPMLLLTFLLGILFSMRLIVLPQLIGSGMVIEEHWGIQLIQVFHWYVLLFILVVTLLTLLVRYRLMKLSPIDRSEWISRQLLIGPIYSLYQSAYLSLEIGKLFHEGFELRQIIVCLKETKQESLIQHLASKMIQGLEAGIPLADQFQNYHFLSEEFSKIILQGEAKGNLGKELIFYSEWTRKQLFKRLQHWLHFIQPIIFLGVAVLILLVYAAVLLPVYGSIEEVLP